MSAITNCLLASLLFVRAPIPPEAPPDPLGRGYMGIRVGDLGTLVISSVEENGPAKAIGIRPNDRIVRVGTLHPQQFAEVVNHVCSFRPGAIIEVEVQRGEERKVFKLKLACRPPDADQRPYPIPDPNDP